MKRKISVLIIVLCLAIADVEEITSPVLAQGLNEVATASMTPNKKWERPRPPREHILVNDEEKGKPPLITDPHPVKTQA